MSGVKRVVRYTEPRCQSRFWSRTGMLRGSLALLLKLFDTSRVKALGERLACHP